MGYAKLTQLVTIRNASLSSALKAVVEVLQQKLYTYNLSNGKDVWLGAEENGTKLQTFSKWSCGQGRGPLRGCWQVDLDSEQ